MLEKQALRLQQNDNGLDIFVTTMDISDLLKISYVETSGVDFDLENASQGYLSSDNLILSSGVQRPKNDKRMSQIEKYIKFDNGLFPNAIILCVPEKNKGAIKILENGSLPLLQFESEKSCFILDGQHRIYGTKRYIENLKKEGKEVPKFEFPVVIINGIGDSKMAEIFTDINSKGSKLNPSRIDFTYGFYSNRDPILGIMVNVALFLAKVKDSPMKGRIDMVEKNAWADEGDSDSPAGSTVSLSHFQKKLRKQVQYDRLPSGMDDPKSADWHARPFAIIAYNEYLGKSGSGFAGRYYSEYPEFAMTPEGLENTTKVITVWLMKFFSVLENMFGQKWNSEKYGLVKTNSISVHLHLSLILLKLVILKSNPYYFLDYRKLLLSIREEEMAEVFYRLDIPSFYEEKCNWFKVGDNGGTGEKRQSELQKYLDVWIFEKHKSEIAEYLDDDSFMRDGGCLDKVDAAFDKMIAKLIYGMRNS